MYRLLPIIAFGTLLAGVAAVQAWPELGEAPRVKSTSMAATGVQGAPGVITMAPQQTQAVYHSPVFKAGYEFNALAPHWNESHADEETREVSVRTSADGRSWSGWIGIEPSPTGRDTDQAGGRVFAENPVFITGRFFQYRTVLSRPTAASPAPRIFDMKVSYLDSRPSHAQRLGQALGLSTEAQGAQGPEIVSRAGWGSPDPHGNLHRGTDRHWMPAASPAKQVFIHHTVSPSQQSDPAAVVRGIYEYHANTRGWGDIGYSYLVGSNGKIYEGRFGGDNTIAGHVYGFNTGSLGVAIIGCFESGSTCDSVNGTKTQAPTSTQLHAVTELLAWKTTNFGIDPKGTHTFCGTSCLSLRTIATHKDAYPTTCAGNLMIEKLPVIRDETARKKAAYNWAYSAKQESYADIDVSDSDTATVTLKFTNTGSATWSNTTNRLLLSTANPNARTSAFQGGGWINSTTPAALTEASVAPGAVGTFTFQIKRPHGASGYHFEGVRLIAEGYGELRQFFSVHIESPMHFSAYKGQSPYPTITQGSGVQSYLMYKNNGNAAWYDSASIGTAPSGAKPVRLATDRAINRKSAFGSSWGGDQNRAASAFAAVYEADGTTLAADQHVAYPGQIAKFAFSLDAAESMPAGTYREFFRPIVEGEYLMNDPGTFLDVRVSPPTSQYRAQAPYPTIPADGREHTLWLEYKNTSTITWYDDAGLAGAPAGTKPVHLATSRTLNRGSGFGGPWGGDRNRPAVNFAAVYRTDGTAYATNPHAVAPGESARFEFAITAPFGSKPQTYREFFQPIIEGGSTMNDPGTFLDIAVKDPVYASSYAGQAAYPTLTAGGLGKEVYLRYQNTGNTAWYDDAMLPGAPAGTKPLHLATSRDINRRSVFGSSWGGDQNRPSLTIAAVYQSDGTTAVVSPARVEPGQIAELRFTLTAPTGSPPGVYREHFRPLIEGGTIMNDPGTFLDVTVQ